MKRLHLHESFFMDHQDVFLEGGKQLENKLGLSCSKLSSRVVSYLLAIQVNHFLSVKGRTLLSWGQVGGWVVIIRYNAKSQFN